jgi:hypothetical protein
MDQEEKERLILQYKEAGTAARQIDTRIWQVYGLYLIVNGGALALLFRSQGTLSHLPLLVVCDVLFLAGVGQMALVGHLQSYSDYFFERLRSIEQDLEICVHRDIRETPPSQFLNGLHLWLSDLRARDVMPFFTILLCAVWWFYPIYKATARVYPGVSKYLHEPITAWLIICGSQFLLLVAIFCFLVRRKRRLSQN